MAINSKSNKKIGSNKKIASKKKAARRIFKTVILGVVALVALCWSLFRFWDVPVEDIAAVVLGGVFISFGLAILALVFVLLLYALRRFRKPPHSFISPRNLDADE